MPIIYIPGPNNQIIQQAYPDTSSQFPIIADFATTATTAVSSSYAVSSSHAISASYAP